MKKLTRVLGAFLFGSLSLVSCKSEPEPKPEEEQKPLTLQDIKIDPAFEEAAAEHSEMISEAKQKRDEINAKVKASEENAEKLKGILEGR